jgi:hypothetical protein
MSASAPMSEIFTPGALRAANINPSTYLATDYLNHFNEVVMLMGLLPDMPDMLPDVVAWAPKSYERHFADSVFSEKALAIAAYGAAPPAVRARFETVMADLDTLLVATLADLREPDADIPRLAGEAVPAVQALIELASAIINGTDTGAPADIEAEPAAQAAVDALFAAA